MNRPLTCLVASTALFGGLATTWPAEAPLHSLPQVEASRSWVEPMKNTHARFKGAQGTFAHFGDSITVTMAFWAPLAGQPKNMNAAMTRALRVVKAYQKPECWSR